MNLTLEQQFSVVQMQRAEHSLSKEQMLDLLKDAKRLYKIKSRVAANIKVLQLECTMQDRIDILNECERLSDEPKHVVFEELISCVKATMIKDNAIKNLLCQNKPHV